MAEDYQRNRLYEYNLNSNLVLVAERDNKRRADEPTGEVESLAGRQAELRMGVRISKEKPTELLEKLEKSKAKRARVEADDELVKRKRQSKNVFLSGVGSTVLSATDELEASAYKPTTRESRAAYEEILTFIKQAIGDQPRDILRGAAEEVLAILKQDDLRDPTKHTEIEKILSKMSAERFNRLVNLGKQIHDFSVGQSAEDDEDRENKLDEDMGVAVVFDEDEDEDGGDVDEVRESEDDDDDDEGGVETTAGQGLRGGVEEEEMDVHDPYKLDVHDIDAHWLQRGLSKYYDDANMSAKLAEDILKILAIPDERDCENKLVMLLNYDKFDFIKLLMRNKLKVLYCTRLKQAQTDDERRAIEEEMRADVDGGGAQILEQLYQQSTAESWVADRTAQVAHKARQEARALRGAGKSTANADADEDALPTLSRADHAGGPRPEKVLDLEALTFAQGGHLMTNRRVELPEQSWRAQKKGYEEVHVPAVKVDVQGEKLVRIDELEPWMQPAFKGYTTLNRIQSRLAHTALEKAENMLLCAPTGAGKTNVALLCMLGEIAKHRNEDGSLRLNEFKIVYVAPMKALVQECVTNFSQRLNPFGITVKELSGDQSLSRQQIQETQVIVTTPEKWDIITRKSGDRTYTQLVRLIIIDEIHLLHDERGPVLETIVARSIRQVETTQDMIRLVGLSATLPNYEDVATFLRVDPKEGLFYFDSAFRPIPLQQQYIGITEKKALKRFQLMNEICYEKVLQCAGKHQVLIFVHSRAETIKTAKALRDMAVENDVLNRFVQEDSGSKEILREESNSVVNPDLKDLLPYGFAIHHAGLVRDDRNLVEDLFADKHVQVLVSTATLAWGVNLPAHTVILKGTQMYNPEQGRWTELSPLDIMQMMGRAGRPGFDSEGEGIIITQHSELQYYLSLMNQQLPIESQLIKRLADLLNAEAVLGTINTVREAAEWLGYTYLYVRMRRNPGLYGITPEEFERDPTLLQRRLDLAYSACALLDRNNLIKYDRRSGVIQVTTLGRVASYYYISHESMAVYNEYLKPTMSDIEIFRLFSLSGEFKQIHVRDEEKLELQKLVVRVPIPIKEGIDEPSAKVNVLLQAYISRLKLEGFALVSDMTYIQQSATRIMRALFEIALKRGWAALAERILICCKLVEKRIWRSQSPMRQFGKIPEAIIRKLEKNSDLTWDRYYDLKPADLGEIVRMPKMGKTLHKYVHMFPRLELSANVQPITRSLLKVELTIMPDFQYDIDIHGFALLFWILVVDGDGERILHQEPFMLKGQYADQEHTVNFSVPIIDPLPPQYFIKVVADRWLHAVTVLPVSFKELILPHKYPPPTELLDLKPLPVHALKNREYEALYQHLREFNPIQTQTYSTLYQSNDNTLVCAPAGSGKTICGEFAILRMFNQNPDGKCVYLAPKSQIADRMYDNWVQVFVGGLGKTVVRLTGETSVDLKLLERGHIIISDVQQWDALSRRWKQRKHVQNVSLYISDELHLLGGVEGHTLEVILSRARYVASQLEKDTRIVGLGASMANAKDIGDWLGVPPTALFNFAPDVRPVPLEVRLHGLDVNHFSSRMLAMAKPTYNAVANDLPAIVFVPSRSQAQLTAVDLSIYAQASEDPDRFLAVRPEEMEPVLETIKESALRDALKHGVGYLHMGLLRSDRERVEALWNDGVIKVLVAPYTMCWSIATAGHTVVVMGTEYYEGKEHRYVDYPVTDILQMLGLACRPQDSSGKCVVLCHAPKKDYLKKILHDPLPVESHLNHFLHDHMNAEVVTRTIENKQDAVDYMTWTFFYRRLTQNPNYYNLDMVNDIRISEYLSNLIESTLADLSNSGCLVVEDEFEVSPLNLGMIAAYYYIQYTTMEIFASSVKEKTKVKGICDIICAASEYANIPMRHQEEAMLERLARHLPQKLPASASFSDAATKAQVLLFSHFTRQALVSDLRTDLHNIVLADCVRLLQAIVDVISSNGWLKPALAAMEVSQMCVQGIWNSDSPLLQIPHFTPEVVERCATHDPVVESVFDILELEDDDRNELLQMTPEQLSDVARFCNNYPNIEVNYDLQTDGDVYTDDAVEMVVELQREVDESGVYGKVMSTRFPHDKTESWWLVVGDPSNNSLLAIKRVTIGQAAKVKLQFNAPEDAGDYNLVLYLMCDSYSGCDQEYEFNLAVLPGQKETDMDL